MLASSIHHIMFAAKCTACAVVFAASMSPAMAQHVSAQHHQHAPALSDIMAERAALVTELQAGGLVLLFRHDRTEVPSRADDYTRAPEECRSQRNLSVAGMAAAQENGAVLRALEIPVGRVISSPMCRSTESARFMFGVDYETDTRLMHHDPAQDAERNLHVATAELRDLLNELAPGLERSNIALITHGAQIFNVTGRLISEGEMAVLRLGEDGSIEVRDNLMVGDLSPNARQKLAQEAGE